MSRPDKQPQSNAQSGIPTQYTPAYIDQQYDNRARVPEFGAHLADWAKRSLVVRETSPCAIDLPFGPAPAERLDLFLPQKVNPPGKLAPVLVFLHGGYWRALDKSDHSFVAPTFTAQGVLVVVVNYDLCPGTAQRPVRIPDIALQVTRAMVWVHAHIAQYGGDPSRVVVAGHSAGGHLAAMMLACDWPGVDASIAPGWIRQAVSLSGLFDLEPLRIAPSFQASLCLDTEQVHKASPVFLKAPKAGQLSALVGGDESDEFLRQNQLIRKVWGKRAVPVCESPAGLNHFSVLQAITQADSPVVKHLLNAVARTAKT